MPQVLQVLQWPQVLLQVQQLDGMNVLGRNMQGVGEQVSGQLQVLQVLGNILVEEHSIGSMG